MYQLSPTWQMTAPMSPSDWGWILIPSSIHHQNSPWRKSEGRWKESALRCADIIWSLKVKGIFLSSTFITVIIHKTNRRSKYSLNLNGKSENIRRCLRCWQAWWSGRPSAEHHSSRSHTHGHKQSQSSPAAIHSMIRAALLIKCTSGGGGGGLCPLTLEERREESN